MKYKPHNPTNRMRAKALLKQLLPEARRAKEKDDLTIKASSSVGANSLPHYSLDKCVGVHVYVGDKGGWFADLKFSDLPPGIPRVLGTPVSQPMDTREEAIQAAVGILVLALSNDKPGPSVETTDAIFPFDGVIVTIPSSVLGKVRDATSFLDGPSHEVAIERLELFRREVCDGERLTVEIADSLSEHDRIRLLAVCSMAMIAGMVQYPEPQEAAPAPRGPLH